MHPAFAPHPTYTGAPASAPPFHAPMMGHHPHHGHGFCHSCCHPRSHCQCHRRECRKESKELLVTPAPTREGVGAMKAPQQLAEMMRLVMPSGNENAPTTGGLDTAFIGGGCCVHLSVEYAGDLPTQPFGVGILVADSEGTLLFWGKGEKAGTPYQIKEGIITTKPGAKLTVGVVNATARVRWCEIFSC